MLGFKDLHFKFHWSMDSLYHYRAAILFDNGSSMSIISGRGFYCNRTLPYEVLIYGMSYEFLKEHDIHKMDGIVGYCSSNDVQQWMERLQLYDHNTTSPS